MGNLTFRGSAKSKGFDPLNVPDETNKLLIETNRTLQGMREVRDQNYRNRQAVQSAIDNNFAKEERQRDRNQNLLEDFRDIYHKAELQHYETRIKNAQTAETEARRKYDQFNKLKDLSVSAFRAVADFNRERGQRILQNSEAAAVRTYQALGLTGAEYDAAFIESLERNIPIKAVIKSKHPNIPHHVIDKALGGWHGMATHIEHFEDYVQSGQLSRDIDEKLKTREFNGVTASQMAANPDDVDGKEYNAALTEIQNEMITKLIGLGYSPRFVLNNFVENIDAEIGKHRMAHANSVADNDKRLSDEARATEFNASIIKNKGIGVAIDKILDPTLIKQGNGGVLAGEVIQNVKTYFNEDMNLTQTKWHEFESTSIRDHNGKYVSAKKWFELKGEGEWYKATAERVRQRQENDRAIQERDLQNAQYKSMQLIEEKAANQAYGIAVKSDYDDVKNQITMEYKLTEAQQEQVFAPLRDQENREPIDDQRARVYIENKLDSPGGLPVRSLQMFSPNIKREYFSRTNEAQGLDPKLVDQAYADLHTEIDNISGESMVDADKKSYQNIKIKEKGLQDFHRRFRRFLDEKKHPNSTAALEAFQKEILKEIETRTGFYATNGRKGKDFKFTSVNQPTPRSTRLYELGSQVAGNPAALKNPYLLSSEEKDQIADFALYGGPVPMTLQVLNYGLPAYDVYQISEEVLGIELERNGLSQIPTVAAKDRLLVTHMTSFARTYRYISGLVDENISGLDYMADAMIGKDIFNANSEDPYSVFRTNSGLDFNINQPITGLEVDEVNNALKNGSFINAGAYDLNSDDINKAIFNNEITPQDVFDADTQKLIYKNKLLTESSMFEIDGLIEPIPGLGKYHAKSIKKTRRPSKKPVNLTDTKVGKFVDKLGIAAASDPIDELVFSNFEKYLKQLFKARREEVEQMPKREGRGKLIQETKRSIWEYDLAERGFNVPMLTTNISDTFNNLINE